MSKRDTEPYYQSGDANVEHRNIDQAGSDHPFGDKPKEWEADLRPLIREFADDLYDSWHATIREYLANAETACLKTKQFNNTPEQSPYESVTVTDEYEPRITVRWDRSKQKLIIQDNGIGMTGEEVDKVFRHIGRSAARDIGKMSGAFGMGVLSFPKFIGTGESSMIMLSNSRLNEDNAAYLVSMAGIEPIRGSLDEEEYGTKFSLDQKSKDMDIRTVIEKYSEWMRVPVLYREIDENGEEVFNEDWGDKRLFDRYDDEQDADYFIKEGFFEAFTSPDATGKTLLLSMDIDRNGPSSTDSVYPFDVRLLDESGSVVKSSNGNEGLIPVSRPEYEQMLLDDRQEYITESLLSNQDVVAHIVPDVDADYVVSSEVLNSDKPLPVAEYETIESVDSEKVSNGRTKVIIGPHSGRGVVSEERWNNLPTDRADNFMPADELADGDICLPKPTTNRSSLQSNDEFWKYIGKYFAEQYDKSIEKYRKMLREADDEIAAIQSIEEKTVANMKEELNNA